MKNCTHCTHANWKRTSAGRLHPSGDGRCTKEIRIPDLPAAFYWINPPVPSGGPINRRQDHERHCPHFAGQP